MTSNIIKIVDVAESNDSTFDKDTNEDYEQMLKIEVYNLNTGWMTLFLYIIVSSVSEKLKWLSIIKTFLENSECIVQSQQNPDYKDIIYTFEKDKFVNVNCIQQISQSVCIKHHGKLLMNLFNNANYFFILQVFLLGAIEGLFSVHIKTQNEQIKHDLIPIVGPKLVNDFIFLPKLQLVLMIAGMLYKNDSFHL